MAKQLKILVVGGGGREHALLWKLSQSTKIERLYCAPGNAGTRDIADNVDIKATNIAGLIEFAKNKGVDITVIGPDDPLAAGIVDQFELAGLKAFGPSKAAARIESSKAYSKNLMAEQQIATAKFEVFKDTSKALSYLQSQKFPVVVKASGLALGKGVFVCRSFEEAKLAIEAVMTDKIFGSAGDEAIIEEYIEGPEVSVHAICDGKDFVMFPPAQDHKPIYDGDKGPNTGGMGAIAPMSWFSGQQPKAAHDVVGATLRGLLGSGNPFRGCLYPGLKITPAGIKVLEFNARFGDPETQVYMRLLETDLVDIIEACLDHRLGGAKLKWRDGFAACIVLASEGYPGKYQTGLPITGLDQVKHQKDVVVFHAGTSYDQGTLTAGGRVLNVTAIADTLEQALAKAYEAAKLINFEGMQYRRDIGQKAIGYTAR